MKDINDLWSKELGRSMAINAMSFWESMWGIKYDSVEQFEESMRRGEERRQKEADEARCPHCGHSPLEDDW